MARVKFQFYMADFLLTLDFSLKSIFCLVIQARTKLVYYFNKYKNIEYYALFSLGSNSKNL